MSRKRDRQKEVPGFVGAFTQTHTNTRLQLPDRACRMRMSETHTHLRSPEKLVRTYMHREVASNRNWREKNSNYQAKINSRPDTGREKVSRIWKENFEHAPSDCKIIDPLVPKDISSGGGLFKPNLMESLGVAVANDGLDWGWEA